MGILNKFSSWLNGEDDDDYDAEYENYIEESEDEDYEDEGEKKPSLFARMKARFLRSDDDLPEEEDEEPVAPAEPAKSNLSAQNTRLRATYSQATAQREKAYSSAVNRQANVAGTFSHTSTPSYPQKTPFAPEPQRTASLNAAANAPQRQFSVMKPTSFEDSSSIVDVLRRGKAIIVNFEGFSPAISQRIMDFICGCIYTIDGQILQISGFIFIVAPKDVDITGDYTAFLQQDSFGVPTFKQ